MCKTFEEVTEKLKEIKTLKDKITTLETEIECLKKAQCGGCKLRTRNCEDQCDALRGKDQ
jgi:hypothetical protein